jgi:hypothetical protein
MRKLERLIWFIIVNLLAGGATITMMYFIYAALTKHNYRNIWTPTEVMVWFFLYVLSLSAWYLGNRDLMRYRSR